MPKHRKTNGRATASPRRTRPADHLTIPSSLWRMFERSGAVSAYIAYRLQLSRAVRDPYVPVESLPPAYRPR